jgi:hypothetical protein
MLFIQYQCPVTVRFLNTITRKRALTKLSQNNVDNEVRVRTSQSEMKIHISVYHSGHGNVFTFSYFILHRVGRGLGQNDLPFKVFYLMYDTFSGYKPLTCYLEEVELKSSETEMKLEINAILKDSLISVDTPGENLIPNALFYSCFIRLHIL